MKVMFSLFVLVTVAAVISGELCTPDQWEGYEASFGGYEYHMHPGVMKEHNKISYDAKNKRMASFITYINNDYENRFQMVMRYKGEKAGKVYLVDLKKGTCWSKTLDKAFPKACIPDDAKKIHEYSLGLMGDDGLKVTGYTVKMEKGGGVYFAVIVNKDKTIIPVLENIEGTFGSTVSYVEAIQYGDITPGIKNATIFDVPEQCEDEEQPFVPEYLMRQRFFMSI